MIVKGRIGCLGLAGALVVGGCATEVATGKKAPDADAATAVPANYRQLIIRHTKAAYAERKVSMHTILKAEITRPGGGGLAGLGRSFVCVRLTVKTDSAFVSQQTFETGYNFYSGKIENVFYPGNINPALGGAFGAALLQGTTCGSLTYSSFPELMAARTR
jgi:hypothetical protein